MTIQRVETANAIQSRLARALIPYGQSKRIELQKELEDLAVYATSWTQQCRRMQAGEVAGMYEEDAAQAIQDYERFQRVFARVQELVRLTSRGYAFVRPHEWSAVALTELRNLQPAQVQKIERRTEASQLLCADVGNLKGDVETLEAVMGQQLSEAYRVLQLYQLIVVNEGRPIGVRELWRLPLLLQPLPEIIEQDREARLQLQSDVFEHCRRLGQEQLQALREKYESMPAFRVTVELDIYKLQYRKYDTQPSQAMLQESRKWQRERFVAYAKAAGKVKELSSLFAKGMEFVSYRSRAETQIGRYCQLLMEDDGARGRKEALRELHLEFCVLDEKMEAELGAVRASLCQFHALVENGGLPLSLWERWRYWIVCPEVPALEDEPAAVQTVSSKRRKKKK
jgi:hypothetical protein